MAPSIRIELNRAGVGELLKSEAVQQMLNRKAEAVAAAARSRAPMVDGDPGKIPLPIETRADPTPTRARAIVEADHPAALAIEAKHRLLGGALDAARH
ncbi:hypothetical protein ACFVWG_24015 [Kribbella sp. NPDC058245]|uniref:hypothetical protein n=1 Tax=Kribbella sp. NPDC058245 TaxID=3346399 RepID=UPI0036E87AC2